MKTKQKTVCKTARRAHSQKGKKPYYIGELVLFSTILKHTIVGIVLSEIVLCGDPLYQHATYLLSKKLYNANTYVCTVQCTRTIITHS